MTRFPTRHWLVPALLALAWAFAGPPAASAVAKDTDSDADEPREERGWLPVDITLRHTQGGLAKADLPGAMGLGGGQVALDVRLGDRPLWLSLAGEYYKEYFPSAKQTWEIEQIYALYLFYKTERLPRLRAELFAGRAWAISPRAAMIKEWTRSPRSTRSSSASTGRCTSGGASGWTCATCAVRRSATRCASSTSAAMA